MDILTFKNTVHKEDLSDYLSNIKSMYDEFGSESPIDLHIQTYDSDGVELCLVTSKGGFKAKNLHSLH